MSTRKLDSASDLRGLDNPTRYTRPQNIGLAQRRRARPQRCDPSCNAGHSVVGFRALLEKAYHLGNMLIGEPIATADQAKRDTALTGLLLDPPFRALEHLCDIGRTVERAGGAGVPDRSRARPAWGTHGKFLLLGTGQKRDGRRHGSSFG